MNLRALPRLFAWVVVVGFLADLLRRCWIVEAWSVGIVTAVLLALALIPLRATWRAARRNPRADFIRIRTHSN